MKASITDVVMYKEFLQNKKMLAPSTVKLYCVLLEAFLKENPDIDVITPYNEFIIKKSIKKRCNVYYYCLKLYVEFKVTDVYARTKIIDELIRPEQRNDIKRERKNLTEDEILNIINSMNDNKHRVIALIQQMTGVRAGDIIRTKKGNILPEVLNGESVLRINITGKRKKRNVVYIYDPVIQEIILNYMNGDLRRLYNDYIFAETLVRGNKVPIEQEILTSNYFKYWEDLKQAMMKVGIDRADFATHDIRRCFARRVWEKWKDLVVLQNLLNHEDPKTTIRYLVHSGLRNSEYLKELQQK